MLFAKCVHVLPIQNAYQYYRVTRPDGLFIRSRTAGEDFEVQSNVVQVLLNSLPQITGELVQGEIVRVLSRANGCFFEHARGWSRYCDCPRFWALTWYLIRCCSCQPCFSSFFAGLLARSTSSTCPGVERR